MVGEEDTEHRDLLTLWNVGHTKQGICQARTELGYQRLGDVPVECDPSIRGENLDVFH